MTTPHTGYVSASDTLPAPQEGEPKLALASLHTVCARRGRRRLVQQDTAEKATGSWFCVIVTSVEVHAIPTGSHISPWEEQRAFLHSKSQLDHH